MNYKNNAEFEQVYKEIFNQDACLAYKNLQKDEFTEELEKECYVIFHGLMKK